MPTGKVYKRKRFFNFSIHTRLQMRMLFKVWLIVFVSLLLAGTIFYAYSNINVGSSYRLFHVKAQNFLDFLLPVLAGGFVASLVLGVLVALFFPHAIAGPLYRIERELTSVGQGDLTTEIHLRKGSEIPELAEAVNRMVRGLKKRVQNIRDTAGELEDVLQKSGNGDPETVMKRLAGVNERLQATLNDFRL